jgi:excisionase family DNA binding protein
MATPMKLTLSQAARHTGVSKPTLSRWIRKGEISAEKLENGSYRIDASELDRVLSLKERGNAATSNGNSPALQTETPYETGMLQREIDLLRERMADKDAVIADLRRQLEREQDRYERERGELMALLREKEGNIKLLTGQTAQAKPQSWWTRLIGG